MFRSFCTSKRALALRILAGLGFAVPAFLPWQLAAQETNTQLFLSPAAVPEQVYTPIQLTGPGTQGFTASMVPGGTVLNNISIVPTLTADPNGPADGSWSNADLAAINSSNFAPVYVQQPNVDYSATTPAAGSSTVTFNTLGMYFVQVQTNAGNGIFQVNVGDYLAEDNTDDPTTTQRQLPTPPNTATGPDITIISKGDPNDKGGMANAMPQLPKAGTASTVAQVVALIQAAYASNGDQKVHVTLVGHGKPGSIKIGTQRINNGTDQNGGMTVQQFSQAIYPYCNCITLFSCRTAQGPLGASMLQTLGSSTGMAQAYDDTLTIDPTIFDADSDARLITMVPEPASISLILAATPLLLRRWRRAA